MIPKPFKRPSIEIGVRVTRRWIDTEVGNLSVGDIVQDMGLVTELIPLRVTAPPEMTQVRFASGQITIFFTTGILRAFTEGARVGDTE